MRKALTRRSAARVGGYLPAPNSPPPPRPTTRRAENCWARLKKLQVLSVEEQRMEPGLNSFQRWAEIKSSSSLFRPRTRARLKIKLTCDSPGRGEAARTLSALSVPTLNRIQLPGAPRTFCFPPEGEVCFPAEGTFWQNRPFSGEGGKSMRSAGLRKAQHSVYIRYSCRALQIYK